MKQQLSAVDAAWLRMEDPTNLMMVTGVLLFDGRLDLARLRSVIEERLLNFARFRQRVEEPPLGVGLPQWVTDRRFDLDAHIHNVALPAPADKAALEAFVSDLLGTPSTSASHSGRSTWSSTPEAARSCHASTTPSRTGSR
jgi:diacylglycerol O-acyltransferase / wax synthase